MRKLLFLTATMLMITGYGYAQVLRGTVYEAGTNSKLANVFIKDNNNRQLTLTDKNGNFSIRTAAGHTLVFSSPGYTADTLFLTDLANKRIELVTKTISLSEVNITASRSDFNPRAEYPEVYEKSKVYALSPSTWFGKEGRDARRLKRYFRTEAEQRHVDNTFSRAYVGSIVPLKGRELENFMIMYRPTYAFLRSNNSESLAVYINDSYKKYIALPPDKRSQQQLTP